jgi:hypothetical protein
MKTQDQSHPQGLYFDWVQRHPHVPPELGEGEGGGEGEEVACPKRVWNLPTLAPLPSGTAGVGGCAVPAPSSLASSRLTGVYAGVGRSGVVGKAT